MGHSHEQHSGHGRASEQDTPERASAFEANSPPPGQARTTNRNLEVRAGPDASAAGVLLYPQVDMRLRRRFSLPGHRLHVCTVDLHHPWPRIRHELLQLVEWVGDERAT